MNKYKNVKKVLGIGLFIVCLTACDGAKNRTVDREEGKKYNEEFNIVSIQGQWDIENVVENDSSYVRPYEIDHRTSSYIDFRDDNTFGVMTNCNHLGGQYSQTGDSIQLTEISSTEMACDNMELEEKLKKVLPIVNSIDCINDSITRLNTEKGDSYIVLRKRAQTVK